MRPSPCLSQALRLLELIMVRPVSTLDARRMGIMHPAMRVCELRKQGHPIDTIKTWQTDERGRLHQVAIYVWNPQQKRQAELWN